jgi:hypothetical protein
VAALTECMARCCNDFLHRGGHRHHNIPAELVLHHRTQSLCGVHTVHVTSQRQRRRECDSDDV